MPHGIVEGVGARWMAVNSSFRTLIPFGYLPWILCYFNYVAADAPRNYLLPLGEKDVPLPLV